MTEKRQNNKCRGVILINCSYVISTKFDTVLVERGEIFSTLPRFLAALRNDVKRGALK